VLKSSSPPSPSRRTVLPSRTASCSNGRWKPRLGDTGGSAHASRYGIESASAAAAVDDPADRQLELAGGLGDQLGLVDKRMVGKDRGVGADPVPAGDCRRGNRARVEAAAEPDAGRRVRRNPTRRRVDQPREDLTRVGIDRSCRLRRSSCETSEAKASSPPTSFQKSPPAPSASTARTTRSGSSSTASSA
jgi:hypothetical protein